MSDGLLQAIQAELVSDASCQTIADLAGLFGCSTSEVPAAIERRLGSLAPGYSIDLGRTRVTLSDNHLTALLPLPSSLIRLLESDG